VLLRCATDIDNA